MLEDARKQMQICNACRYCEGYCAVFPAMEERRKFEDGDLIYLANLCFDCRACYNACPYIPPHEYAINLPQVFSEIRVETYKRYTGPRMLVALFLGDTIRVALTGVLICAAILVAILLRSGSGDLFGVHKGEGAFYDVVPYAAMLVPALVLSCLWLAALAGGAFRFWESVDGNKAALFDLGALRKATADAIGLTYLRGGGEGCDYPGEEKSMARRWYHQALVAGVLLDFVSTALAAFYDHFLDQAAPYALVSPVVLTGISGGVLILAGAAGLLWLKIRADSAPSARAMLGLDFAFLWLLLLTSATGLLLFGLRGTGAMGPLLAVHLGIVAVLFLTLPYGKFAHVAYRYAALVKNAREQRAATSGAEG